MSQRKKTLASIRLTGALAMVVIAALAAPLAAAADFVDTQTAPFGVFDGVEYVIHSGRFEGATSLGAFRMPYEIVAPADPTQGVGTLLIEPPHFAFAPLGRDLVLGREFLFNRGLRYASVGFGLNGSNTLDPFADDMILAGETVVPPVGVDLAGVVDEEILVQFVEALTLDPLTSELLGHIERRYAYGISQTSSVLLEIHLGPYGPGLFDLTLLHVALWQAPFQPSEVFDNLFDGPSAPPVPFDPPAGVGKMIFVESEGDQIFASRAEAFRSVVGLPEYRIYEVAGAEHFDVPITPDHSMTVRALLVRGDDWVRWDVEPPASIVLDEDASGAADPVYGFVTGIARDTDGNALGGVRFPDLEVGRAQFIAADPSIGPIPGLLGRTVDLECTPAPDGSVRFPTHGDYVGRVVRQANALRQAGLMLDADAEILKERAAASKVGSPGNCP